MKTTHRAFALATAILSLQLPAAQGDVTFSDDTFNNADWTMTTASHGNGGTTTAIQRLSGGNSGAYREIEVVLNADPPGGASAIAGFHWRKNAIYNPAAQGTIDFIDYSEDAILLSGAPSQGHAASVILRQGTNIYVPATWFITPETAWTAKQQSGLRDTNFVRMLVPDTYFDPAQHPNFSASGEPIQFGFVRDLANSGAGTTRTTGIDNWSVTVRTALFVTIRVSEVEVCWNARTNRTYLVQYRSNLTTNQWADLLAPIPGSSGTNCITDKVLVGQPQRFYRVVETP